MKTLLLFPLVLLVGCVNTTTNKYICTMPDGSFTRYEMPGELKAKSIKFMSNAKTGETVFEATNFESHNVETIKAQGAAEVAKVKAIGNAVPQVGTAVGNAAGAAIKSGL